MTQFERKHSDATIDEISRLWAEGVSGSEIGRRLGLSKNMVVGLKARNGITRPVEAEEPQPIEISRAPAPPIRPVSARERHYFALGGGCRYIFGEPVEMRFCGAPRVEGRPYCAEHCVVSYRLNSHGRIVPFKFGPMKE